MEDLITTDDIIDRWCFFKEEKYLSRATEKIWVIR